MTREISLRPALPGDAMAVATVHVRSWQAGYKDLLPQHYLESMNPEERAARYDFSSRDITRPHTFVVAEADLIVGFVTITLPDGIDSRCGEINGLYVDPDHWRRGVGTELLRYAIRHLATFEIHFALLWVLKGNAQAIRFYERLGWTSNNRRRVEPVWGLMVEEIQFQYIF